MKIQTEDVLLDIIDVFSPIASEKYSEDRKDGEQIERLISKIIQMAGYVPLDMMIVMRLMEERLWHGR